MFLLVFRPHQRPAWCYCYNDEDEFVNSFQRDHFARNCNADCDGETMDAMAAATSDEARYEIVFERVAHDLNCLTRLDSADEVTRYLCERDYCGHHNKGYASVETAAREIGWLTDDVEDDEADAEGTGCGRGDFESED